MAKREIMFYLNFCRVHVGCESHIISVRVGVRLSWSLAARPLNQGMGGPLSHCRPVVN